MLADCAPGHELIPKTYTFWVRYGGKTYRDLPKYDPMQRGHVKKMARFLGIYDCAVKILGLG